MLVIVTILKVAGAIVGFLGTLLSFLMALGIRYTTFFGSNSKSLAINLMILQGIDGLFFGARLIVTWNTAFHNSMVAAKSCVLNQVLPNVMLCPISVMYLLIVLERMHSLLCHINAQSSTEKRTAYVIVCLIAPYFLLIVPLILLPILLFTKENANLPECSLDSLTNSGFLSPPMVIGAFIYASLPLFGGLTILIVALATIATARRKQAEMHERDHYIRFKLSEVMNGLTVFIAMNSLFFVRSIVLLAEQVVTVWISDTSSTVQEAIKLLCALHSIASVIVCFVFLHRRIRYPQGLYRLCCCNCVTKKYGADESIAIPQITIQMALPTFGGNESVSSDFAFFEQQFKERHGFSYYTVDS